MRKILWASLVYTLLVIIWGAWVRISHSGDGCGASWPLCLDQVIPTATHGKTWIEYTHRAMSGLYGFLILGLTIYLHRATGVSKQARFWIRATLFFMITEALLGANLVIFGLVGKNDTPSRAFVMGLHFFNSLLLTGSLALTTTAAGSAHWRKRNWTEISGVSQRILRRIPTLTAGLFLLIGITGTIAALSNTLYPADSLLSGLAADLDSSSHYLVRLRGLHPTLGFSIGLGMTIFFYLVSEALDAGQTLMRNHAFYLSLGFAFTVIVGATTLLLQAPVFLKLSHLMVAHGLWILIVTFWYSLRRAPTSA